MVIFPGGPALTASRAGRTRKRSAKRPVAFLVTGTSLARKRLGVVPHRAIHELLVGDGRLARLDAAELLLGGHHGIEVLLGEAVVPDRPQLDAGEERQRV